MANIQLEYIQKGVEQVKKDLGEINLKVAEANKNKVKVEFESSELDKYKNDLQSLISINHSIREAMKSVAKGSDAWKTLNSESNKCYKNISKLKQELLQCGSDGAKAIVEVVNAQQTFDRQIEQSARTQKMNTEAFKRNEKEKQDEIRKTASAEQEVIRLRKEAQAALRQLGDASNLNKKGAKTGLDVAYLQKQVQEIMKQFESLREVLGDNNKEIQHFLDGIDFTKLNNELRKSRDEAQKLANDIPKISKDLEALKLDPTKNKNQIALDEDKLESYKQKLAEIISTQQEFYSSKATQYGLSEQEIQDAQIMLNKLQEQCNLLSQENIIKQQSVNADKLNNQQYQDLKKHVQEIYSLEEKLERLKKDKNGNKSEIRITEEILNNKKREYQIENEIKKLEGNRRIEIEGITKEHQETLKVIEAQKNKSSELGDTIKKVFNYIAVYKGFSLLTQGIQQAIDTMKELDKAFTDIQMVTMGTNEETAKLAKEYNNLAKSLGATTIEVAEGAGEWLRQGKNAEETTKLLTASMTLSKVGAIESSEATQLLTSSLNGYKLAAEDAMGVVDKISAIDLAAATSSEELATALARTANIANDSSVSFDKLLAMVGTVSSVTRRSASTIRRSV